MHGSQGTAWNGEARHEAGTLGVARQAGPGLAGTGTVRLCVVRRGRRGPVWSGSAWLDAAWLGQMGHGKAGASGRDVAWSGAARRGRAWQGRRG